MHTHDVTLSVDEAPRPRPETLERMQAIVKDGSIVLLVMALSLPMPILGPALIIGCAIRLFNCRSLVRSDEVLAQLLRERPITDPDVRQFRNARRILAFGVYGWAVLLLAGLVLVVIAAMALEGR